MNIKYPTFSIITPSFNQGDFIEDTIKSVISQEGDFYIEYIIADGASLDKTVDVIKKYDELLKKGDLQIKCAGVKLIWWSKKDRGQTHALNMGFEKATGEYFAYINSDDFYEKDSFKIALKTFNDNKSVSLVHGAGRVLYVNEKTEEIMEAGEVDYEALLRRGCTIFQPSTFFTKKVFDRVGGFDESYNYVMDYDLWLRILKYSDSKYIPTIISNFRVWSDSKTNLHKKLFVKERKILYKKYGGNKIDYGTIGDLRAKLRFLNILKKYFPRTYGFFKKSFYEIVDIFQYKKND